MKIHDKFVIELSEVIKGYGNNYQDEDPCRMPCDYKFYEINGVAICEESFKKMKRLEDEINDVLDKIRAEIERLHYHPKLDFIKNDEVVEMALDIFDKYRGREVSE